MRIVNGFAFNNYCQRCQKVMEHRIAVNNSVFCVCKGCKFQRPLTDLKQVFYPKVDLWVTRFKVSNLDSVVRGKLLDAIRELKN